MRSDFADRPFIAIWETTRACALRCVHCRAEAIPHRDPDELTTDEGKQLMDRVAAFGSPRPILVLTGGDPLRRPDIEELVAHGTSIGLSVSLTPSGTARVTEDRLRALQQVGLARLAVSLDGATAESHDAFRGVRGSHRFTLAIIERARTLGLPLQINTTVCRQTLAELPALAAEVERMGAVLWALFFLIPVGRAEAGDALSAADIERVLRWAAAQAGALPLAIKTTEAPQYHRVLAQGTRRGATPPFRTSPLRLDCAGEAGARNQQSRCISPTGSQQSPRPGPAGSSGAGAAGPRDDRGRAGRALTDGNGFVFIDHVGNICPSGFLPLPTGNVRADDLVAVYRHDPLFVSLRDFSRLGGRCGRCEYRERCGGSRARAWSLAGDPLAEDPGCAWQPGEPELAPIAGGSDAPLAGHSDAPISGGSDAPVAVTPDQVLEALGGVLDPELGMSVVDLGLVYGVDIDGGSVSITMTLTAPGCPIHDAMAEWVERAVTRIPGVTQVRVTITFDPPWTPDRIKAAPRRTR